MSDFRDGTPNLEKKKIEGRTRNTEGRALDDRSPVITYHANPELTACPVDMSFYDIHGSTADS